MLNNKEFIPRTETEAVEYLSGLEDCIVDNKILLKECLEHNYDRTRCKECVQRWLNNIIAVAYGGLCGGDRYC